MLYDWTVRGSVDKQLIRVTLCDRDKSGRPIPSRPDKIVMMHPRDAYAFGTSLVSVAHQVMRGEVE